MPFSKKAKRELSDAYTQFAITNLDFLLTSVQNCKSDTKAILRKEKGNLDK